MEWHAHAESYPLLEGDEYEAFRADIDANGVKQPIRYRVINGSDQGLDGRNRLRACTELKIDCPRERVEVADALVPAYIDSLNLHRRHLSKDQRVARVQAMSSAGQSERQIAKALNLPKSTVHYDLANGNTGGQNRPLLPETAQNGTHSQGKTRHLCARCQRNERTGQPRCKNCPECRDLNRTGKKPGKKSAKPDDAPAPVDAFGNELPQRCRAAYGDPWIQQSFDLLATTQAALLKARLADGMSKRKKHYPFFEPKDFIDGIGFVTNYLDNLIDHLKINRPAGVCPSCQGKGCGTCRMSGLLPRGKYAEAKK